MALVERDEGHPSSAAASASRSARALCRAAIVEYDRLYHELDEDPDLGWHITYAVSRNLLERRLGARDWVVPIESSERIMVLLEEVRAAADRDATAIRFPSFAERVLADLERRGVAGNTTAPRHHRRWYDRATRSDTRPPIRIG